MKTKVKSPVRRTEMVLRQTTRNSSLTRVIIARTSKARMLQNRVLRSRTRQARRRSSPRSPSSTVPTVSKPSATTHHLPRQGRHSPKRGINLHPPPLTLRDRIIAHPLLHLGLLPLLLLPVVARRLRREAQQLVLQRVEVRLDGGLAAALFERQREACGDAVWRFAAARGGVFPPAPPVSAGRSASSAALVGGPVAVYDGSPVLLLGIPLR